MATPTTLPATFVAGNVLTAAQMNDLRGAFRILQVINTIKTDQFSTTSASFVDVTGVSLSITPSATSSNILIFVTGTGSVTNNGVMRLNLLRDSTNIAQSTGATNNSTSTVQPTAIETLTPFTIIALDSPNTTSATTYKLQGATPSAATLRIGGNNSTPLFGSATTITALEVSA